MKLDATILKVLEISAGLGCFIAAHFVPAASATLITVGTGLISAGGVNHHANGDIELLGMRISVLKPAPEDHPAPQKQG